MGLINSGHGTPSRGCLTVSEPLLCFQWSLSTALSWADGAGFNFSDILTKLSQDAEPFGFHYPMHTWPGLLPGYSPLWTRAPGFCLSGGGIREEPNSV